MSEISKGIVKDFESGMTRKEIKEKYDVSYTYVCWCIKRYNKLKDEEKAESEKLEVKKQSRRITDRQYYVYVIERVEGKYIRIISSIFDSEAVAIRNATWNAENIHGTYRVERILINCPSPSRSVVWTNDNKEGGI